MPYKDGSQSCQLIVLAHHTSDLDHIFKVGVIANLKVSQKERTMMKGVHMMIDITSKAIEVTPAIRERIDSRFAKLERLQVPLITPQVIVTKEGLEFVIEAHVGIPNGQLFAEARHEDLYAAVTQLGQKLERQLTRYASKPDAHRAARSGKEQCRAGEINPAGERATIAM